MSDVFARQPIFRRCRRTFTSDTFRLVGVRCLDCTAESLVAVSCKDRRFCPSCTDRRVASHGAPATRQPAAGTPSSRLFTINPLDAERRPFDHLRMPSPFRTAVPVRPATLFLFGLPFLALAAIVALAGTRDPWLFLESSRWPETEATIVQADAATPRTPLVRIDRGSGPVDVRAKNLGRSGVLDVGARVPARFDPSDPGRVVVGRRFEPALLTAPAVTILFGFAGLAACTSAVVMVVRAARRRRRVEEEPLRPWRWEGEFDGHASVAGGSGAPLARWAVVIAVAAIVLPLAAIFANTGFFDDGWIAPVLFGVFGIALLALVLGAILATLRRLRFGVPRLHFRALPLAPGERLDAVLVVPRRLAPVKPIVATVRILKTITDTTRTHRGVETTTWTEVARALPFEVAPDRVAHGRAGTLVPIEVTLPEGRGRGEEGQVVWSWDVRVVAVAGALTFDDTFALPVYDAGVSAPEPRPGPMPA